MKKFRTTAENNRTHINTNVSFMASIISLSYININYIHKLY